MRAVKIVRLESGPAVAASRNGATESSGRGTQAIQPPSGSTGTACPLTPSATGPRAPRTAPKRNAESCDCSTSVGAGQTTVTRSDSGRAAVGAAGPDPQPARATAHPATTPASTTPTDPTGATR